MADHSNHREILAAALSAHVSELRLFWRETGLFCRWLVPDGEHCTVGQEMLKHLRAFRERITETITNEDVRVHWLERSAMLLDDEEGTMPFPLRTLTWLLRIVESPHREDLTVDSWNLYLWNIRMHDLPTRVMKKLSSLLETQAKQALIDLDTLMSRFSQALESSIPSDTEKHNACELMRLNKRFDRLRRFKNLIFYGVANIGKANLSKQLIGSWKQMTGRDIGHHCVTVFHANMRVEDMVERRVSGDMLSASRPMIDHSSPRVIANHISEAKYFFEPFTNENIQEGLLLALCRAAAYNPDKDYVFMIDCIDECRLEDVLGEVSHMLDCFARVSWRKEAYGGAGAWDLEAPGARSIRLSQSGRVFFIPANVYILGTANELGLFAGDVDDHLFQTFAVEYLEPRSADALRVLMLSNRSRAAFARLEEYVDHSIALWKAVNEVLIHVGGHRNIIGYGPLLSMCEEILNSGDVYEANRIVLGTWRYRMIPPIRLKMEELLYGDADHREALDALMTILNQSWLQMQIRVEGLQGSESIYMTFEPEFVL